MSAHWDDGAREVLDREPGYGRTRPGTRDRAVVDVGLAAVEWLQLSGRSVRFHLDPASRPDVVGDDFKDVYEFPPVDPEEEHREGTVLATFADSDEVLAAGADHGARVDRWVSDGTVKDEYTDAIDTQG